MHTKIEASHEYKVTVNDKELFMMSPVEDNIVCRAINRLECVFGYSGQVKIGEVLEWVADFWSQIVSSRDMVGMSEDFDIRVQLLKSMFGVLHMLQISYEKTSRKMKGNKMFLMHTAESRVRAASTSLYTMTLTWTPRSAAAWSRASRRYCSLREGGRRRYSSGLSHQSRIYILSWAPMKRNVNIDEAGAELVELTLKSFRHCPKVRGTVNEPFDVARRRGGKGLKPVGSMFSVKIITLIARVWVRMFFNVRVALKEGFDSVEETHGAALQTATIQ
jgi:hypothetical protein